MEFHGLTYAKAVEIAGEPRKRAVKQVIRVRTTFSMWPYLYGVAQQYHEYLLQMPGAINYMHTRGLTDETLAKYSVGYTDGAVINPESDEEYKLALSSGVITEDEEGNWREALSHRITIPNILPNTNYCDFIMGRTVTKNEVRYLGLSIPKTLYGLVDAKDSPVLFMVEGYIDWLILKQWGYPAITAGGTHVANYNLVPLKERRIIIIPDNDDEGTRSADNLHKALPYSTILDYADLKAKDVGDLGMMDEGMALFDQKVREQISWLPSISPTTLNLWFPRLGEPTHLHST